MAIIALIALISFTLRIAFLPIGPEGWDAVDFILALDDYDLGQYQPHFPGYPLYILAARTLAWMGSLDGEVALRVVGATSGALLPIPIARLLRAESDASPVSISLLTLLVAAGLAPALALGSVRIESDLPGLLILIIAFLAAARRHPTLAGFVGGLAAGVRLGILPLVAGLILWTIIERSPAGSRRRNTWRVLAGCFAGMLTWWIPQILVVGPEFFDQARFFIVGHFTQWGGTALTQPDFSMRLEACGRRIGLGLFGGSEFFPAWPIAAIFFGGGGVLYCLGAWRRRDLWLAYLGLPQAAVVLFLQNPERSRHFYPIILTLATLAATGWLRSGTRWRTVGLVTAALLAIQSTAMLVEVSRKPPSDLAVVDAVLPLVSPGSEWVFCGESSRLFEFRDPQARVVVRRARDLEGVVREVNMSIVIPERLVIFSEVRGQKRGSGIFRVRRNPSVYDVKETEVFLYRVVKTDGSDEISLEQIAVEDLPGPWRKWSTID